MTTTDNKAPATIASMNARIREIHEQMLADSTTTDQLVAFQKEQASLIGAIRTNKESRAKEITDIKSKLTTFDISMEEIYGDKAITSFTDAVLLAETKSRGLMVKPRAGSKKGKTSDAFKSNDNPIFLHIPKKVGVRGPGKDIDIRQGRADEFENGTKMFAPIKPLLLAEVGKDIAETEKNLSKYIVKGFVETPKSKAELKKIATFIYNAKNKTPHNEAQADMQAAT